MVTSLSNTIRAAWGQIADPHSKGDIVSNGRVQSLHIKNGHVQFVLSIDPQHAPQMQRVLEACETIAQTIPGVRKVQGVLTAHHATPATQQQAAAKQPSKLGKPANRNIPDIFAHIHTVIAIASGKGGVGKSTLAINLAAILAQNADTGLLDADIYGPSAPHLLGITDKPKINAQRKVIPIKCFGMHTMSIGYLVQPDQAMIWRGPMVQTAVMQMLTDVVWPKLDVLVLDLPPGTGDVQLTMAQRIPVTAAMIVTTPQALALADVRRAYAMFQRVHIPVLGIVENMSYIDAPEGGRLTPFGTGGGERIAAELNLPLLGQLPLDSQQHNANEEGQPVCAFAPDAPIVSAYQALAQTVKQKLRAQTRGARSKN